MIDPNKKILFLTNIPSPYRVDFFNELGKHCELTVLFERKDSEERDSKWNSKKIKNFTGIFLKGLKKDPDIAFCPQVIKYLNRELYDMVIVGGYSTPTGMLAINYLKLKKIPFILNADGAGEINKNESLLKKKIKTYYISSANYWLSTGNETTNYFKYYGADPKSTFVYPFTTLHHRDILKKTLTKHDKRLLKDKLNMHEDKVIVTVGRFIYSKGFDVLLKACGKVSKDVGIYIIGGQPNQEYIELKDQLDLRNVHFIEFLTQEELKEYYKAADLFVLPTRSDVWGLVINEAMACGLPIVTTDKCVAGLELIENYQNGFIIPSDDPDSLALKINGIIGDTRLGEEMAENNLEKIKNYTIENMAEIHHKIFQEISVRDS